VCGGSGLVLREKEKDYLRCPECGMIAFTSSSSHIMYSIKYAAGRMLLNVSEIFLIYGAL